MITLDLDFGYLFLKFQKGTIIALRPHRSIPDEIVLEMSVEVIQEKEGLIIVKPTKIRVIFNYIYLIMKWITALKYVFRICRQTHQGRTPC